LEHKERNMFALELVIGALAVGFVVGLLVGRKHPDMASAVAKAANATKAEMDRIIK
jgi:hypothetical protein